MSLAEMLMRNAKMLMREMDEHRSDKPASPEDLKKALADYSITYDFKPGDIVRLKENGGPYKTEFSPGIVMETGVKGFSREDSSCQGLEETMRIGVMVPDGSFISFLVIPNYWEPCPE